MAGCDLVKGQGGVVVECACMIELGVLNGRAKVAAAHPGVPVWSMISEKVLTLNGVTGKRDDEEAEAAADAGGGGGDTSFAEAHKQ